MHGWNIVRGCVSATCLVAFADRAVERIYGHYVNILLSLLVAPINLAANGCERCRASRFAQGLSHAVKRDEQETLPRHQRQSFCCYAAPAAAACLFSGVEVAALSACCNRDCRLPRDSRHHGSSQCGNHTI